MNRNSSPLLTAKPRKKQKRERGSILFELLTLDTIAMKVYKIWHQKQRQSFVGGVGVE